MSGFIPPAPDDPELRQTLVEAREHLEMFSRSYAESGVRVTRVEIGDSVYNDGPAILVGLADPRVEGERCFDYPLMHDGHLEGSSDAALSLAIALLEYLGQTLDPLLKLPLAPWVDLSETLREARRQVADVAGTDALGGVRVTRVQLGRYSTGRPAFMVGLADPRIDGERGFAHPVMGLDGRLQSPEDAARTLVVALERRLRETEGSLEKLPLAPWANGDW